MYRSAFIVVVAFSVGCGTGEPAMPPKAGNSVAGNPAPQTPAPEKKVEQKVTPRTPSVKVQHFKVRPGDDLSELVGEMIKADSEGDTERLAGLESKARAAGWAIIPYLANALADEKFSFHAKDGIAVMMPPAAMHKPPESEIVGRSYRSLLWLLSEADPNDAEKTHMRFAREAFSTIERWSPTRFKRKIGDDFLEEGIVAQDAGQYELALKKLGLALKSYHKLVSDLARSDFEIEMAECYAHRGEVDLSLKNLKRALDEFDKATRIYKRLVDVEHYWEFEYEMARCLGDRARVRMLIKSEKNPEESILDGEPLLSLAAKDLDEAIEVSRRLLAANATVEVKDSLARDLLNRAQIYATEGRPEFVPPLFGEAMEVVQDDNIRRMLRSFGEKMLKNRDQFPR